MEKYYFKSYNELLEFAMEIDTNKKWFYHLVVENKAIEEYLLTEANRIADMQVYTMPDRGYKAESKTSKSKMHSLMLKHLEDAKRLAKSLRLDESVDAINTLLITSEFADIEELKQTPSDAKVIKMRKDAIKSTLTEKFNIPHKTATLVSIAFINTLCS